MDQITYAPNLEEGLDQLFISQLGVLLKYFKNQQGESLPVDIRGTNVKMDGVKYPFVGVLTMQDSLRPTMIGDYVSGDDDGSSYLASINEIKVGILIQTREIRELQRLKSFIYLNLNYGKHPVTQEPWMAVFDKNGIVLQELDGSGVRRVTIDSVQQRTARAQGEESMRRTDVETLWEQELNLTCLVETGVRLGTDQSVINDIQYQFQIVYDPK